MRARKAYHICPRSYNSQNPSSGNVTYAIVATYAMAASQAVMPYACQPQYPTCTLTVTVNLEPIEYILNINHDVNIFLTAGMTTRINSVPYASLADWTWI